MKTNHQTQILNNKSLGSKNIHKSNQCAAKYFFWSRRFWDNESAFGVASPKRTSLRKSKLASILVSNPFIEHTIEYKHFYKNKRMKVKDWIYNT